MIGEGERVGGGGSIVRSRVKVRIQEIFGWRLGYVFTCVYVCLSLDGRCALNRK